VQSLTVKAWGWVTADTLDFGACLFRCVLMGQLREHSFELKGYLLRTNIIPHFVVGDAGSARGGPQAPKSAPQPLSDTNGVSPTQIA